MHVIVPPGCGPGSVFNVRPPPRPPPQPPPPFAPPALRAPPAAPPSLAPGGACGAAGGLASRGAGAAAGGCSGGGRGACNGGAGATGSASGRPPAEGAAPSAAGEAEGAGWPVPAAEAPQLLERLAHVREDLEADLASAVEASPSLSNPPAATRGASRMSDTSEASEGGNKRQRLPEPVRDILITLVRCEQLGAHARAAMQGKRLPLLAKGQPSPSAWLTPPVLERLAALVPIDEKALRSRLISYGEQAALPEKLASLVESLPRRARPPPTDGAEIAAPEPQPVRAVG